MEQLLNEIRISYIDPGINQTLLEIAESSRNAPYAMRFSQAEDYFIELGSPLLVPQLTIHHDIQDPIPKADYSAAIKDVVGQLSAQLPECFSGLTYFFDPAEVFKPCFYRLYKAENDVYLYLLRIDLLPKPLESEILAPGTDKKSPAYSTRRLYLESELIPLEAVMWESGRVKAFRIRQMISQTWIGETGKGYLVRGIWMDTDLSKFFTKLFAPPERRIYPFYPLYCKYKTVCASAPLLTSDGRRKMIPLLHHALKLLAPEIGRIQDTLRDSKFAVTLPAFVELHERIPASWRTFIERFTVEAYLNDREQKEYALGYDEQKA